MLSREIALASALLFAVFLSAAFILAGLFSADIEFGWEKRGDHFFSSKPPEDVFREIVSKYGRVFYYGKVYAEDEDVNFPLGIKGAKYSVVVSDRLFLFAGESNTTIFVSSATPSKSLEPFDPVDSVCLELPFRTRTVAELNSGGYRFCYMKVDANTEDVRKYLLSSGKPLVFKGFYSVDGKTVQVVDLNGITGLVIYRKC